MLPSLLLLAILQGSPVVQPAAAVCQDVQRIELSRAHGVSREICVSPGLLTGFVFDASVVVDLEDEIRFAEVSRGRTSISLMPPGDGVAGERLRLTAHFKEGGSVTFVLVVHSGRATRQVEVYRDKRTQETFQFELAQERAKGQQLQQEKEELLAECGDPGGLRRLIVSKSLGNVGVRIQEFDEGLFGYSEGPLSVNRGSSYRSELRVAVEVWLMNSSQAPWVPVVATLVDAQGQELNQGMRLWVEGGAIPPNTSAMVVVEVVVKRDAPPRHVTLSLREIGPRAITLAKVSIP